MRQYGIPARSAGLIVGASAGVFGVVGAMASGFIGDAWAGTGRLDGRFRVNLIACPILILGLFITVLAPVLWLSAAGLCVIMLGGGIGLTGAYSAVPELVPNQLRGQAIAIYSLTANLVGLGVGPTAVAAVTVYLLHDDALIGTSILVACVPAVILGLLLTVAGLRPYRRTRAAILAALG
jgi:MFS family permease